MVRLLFVVGLVAIPARAAELEAVVSKMREQLAQIPDYSCSETIERKLFQTRRRGRFESIDRNRVEVAVVGDRELFSWPGADEFEERPLAEMVGAAVPSSGEFASHAGGVFT